MRGLFGCRIAVAFAAGVIFAGSLADPAPPNGSNTSTFPAIASFTNLVACVQLDGIGPGVVGRPVRRRRRERTADDRRRRLLLEP